MHEKNNWKILTVFRKTVEDGLSWPMAPIRVVTGYQLWRPKLNGSVMYIGHTAQTTLLQYYIVIHNLRRLGKPFTPNFISGSYPFVGAATRRAGHNYCPPNRTNQMKAAPYSLLFSHLGFAAA